MRRVVTIGLLLAGGFVVGTLHSEPVKGKESMIGHMVYFKLNDNSDAKVQELVAACDKYLKDHQGTAFYAAGGLAKEFTREVNDRDWDVGLHLVFKSKA